MKVDYQPAIPAFKIVCDGRVLDIVRLEPAGEVMRIHVSAPGGRQPEVPPGSGRVAVEPSWGDLDAAIERVRSVAAGATARAEEAAAQSGHPVDVLAGIRAADARLICDALAEASRRNVRDGDIIMGQFMELQNLREHIAELEAKLGEMRGRKDAAYTERNRVVALLCSVFPSVRTRTAIEGWSEDWHGCVYIQLPTGQASWHFHDSHAPLFAHVPEGEATWDGHTTDEKYARVARAAGDRVHIPRGCADCGKPTPVYCWSCNFARMGGY